MGQVTLNYEDSMRILNNAKANPDARVIAACFVAFFEAKTHAEDLDSSTRSIVLKLSHMSAAAIYDIATPDAVED